MPYEIDIIVVYIIVKLYEKDKPYLVIIYKFEIQHSTTFYVL